MPCTMQTSCGRVHSPQADEGDEGDVGCEHTHNHEPPTTATWCSVPDEHEERPVIQHTDCHPAHRQCRLCAGSAHNTCPLLPFPTELVFAPCLILLLQ